MTFEQWLQHGVDAGYIDPVCLMHNDMDIWNDDELHRFNNLGEDPCIPRWVVKHDMARTSSMPRTEP
jgi:hypothetical protein